MGTPFASWESTRTDRELQWLAKECEGWLVAPQIREETTQTVLAKSLQSPAQISTGEQWLSAKTVAGEDRPGERTQFGHVDIAQMAWSVAQALSRVVNRSFLGVPCQDRKGGIWLNSLIISELTIVNGSVNLSFYELCGLKTHRGRVVIWGDYQHSHCGHLDEAMAVFMPPGLWVHTHTTKGPKNWLPALPSRGDPTGQSQKQWPLWMHTLDGQQHHRITCPSGQHLRKNTQWLLSHRECSSPIYLTSQLRIRSRGFYTNTWGGNHNTKNTPIKGKRVSTLWGSI